MKKTLIVYYSRTNTSEKVANNLASALNCDVDRIKFKGQKDKINVVNAFCQALSSKVKKISGNDHHPGNYDHVILISPIWMNRPAPAILNYFNQYKNLIKEYSFVAVARSNYKKNNYIEKVSDKKARKTITIRRKDVNSDTLDVAALLDIPVTNQIKEESAPKVNKSAKSKKIEEVKEEPTTIEEVKPEVVEPVAEVVEEVKEEVKEESAPVEEVKPEVVEPVAEVVEEVKEEVKEESAPVEEVKEEDNSKSE